MVDGHEHAFKITYPSDLERARAIFADVRSGIGADAHHFGSDGALMLGCLEWPELPRLEGHSDGDSVAHAIVDALLSAANLGDIGSNFGTIATNTQAPRVRGLSKRACNCLLKTVLLRLTWRFR